MDMCMLWRLEENSLCLVPILWSWMVCRVRVNPPKPSLSSGLLAALSLLATGWIPRDGCWMYRGLDGRSMRVGMEDFEEPISLQIEVILMNSLQTVVRRLSNMFYLWLHLKVKILKFCQNIYIFSMCHLFFSNRFTKVDIQKIFHVLIFFSFSNNKFLSTLADLQ